MSETLGHEDSAGADTAALTAETGDATGALELGQRIREVRQKKGMTLREAAVAADVSESFLSQVERGLANPSVASLRRIADAMGERVASFFVGEPPSSGGRECAGLTTDLDAAFSSGRSLEEHRRRAGYDSGPHCDCARPESC